jgi:hypothetical protein
MNDRPAVFLYFSPMRILRFMAVFFSLVGYTLPVAESNKFSLPIIFWMGANLLVLNWVAILYFTGLLMLLVLLFAKLRWWLFIFPAAVFMLCFGIFLRSNPNDGLFILMSAIALIIFILTGIFLYRYERKTRGVK